MINTSNVWDCTFQSTKKGKNKMYISTGPWSLVCVRYMADMATESVNARMLIVPASVARQWGGGRRDHAGAGARPQPRRRKLGWAGLGWAGLGWAVPAGDRQQHITIIT